MKIYRAISEKFCGQRKGEKIKFVPNFRAIASSREWWQWRKTKAIAQLQTMVYLSWNFHIHIFYTFRDQEVSTGCDVCYWLLESSLERDAFAIVKNAVAVQKLDTDSKTCNTPSSISWKYVRRYHIHISSSETIHKRDGFWSPDTLSEILHRCRSSNRNMYWSFVCKSRRPCTSSYSPHLFIVVGIARTIW